MPEQRALADAEDAVDPFAEARALHPHARLVRYIDRGLGYEWIKKHEPGSDWYDLLPPEQTVIVHRPPCR